MRFERGDHTFTLFGATTLILSNSTHLLALSTPRRHHTFLIGGGGSESLKTDAQGKTHGLALLEMEVER